MIVIRSRDDLYFLDGSMIIKRIYSGDVFGKIYSFCYSESGLVIINSEYGIHFTFDSSSEDIRWDSISPKEGRKVTCFIANTASSDKSISYVMIFYNDRTIIRVSYNKSNSDIEYKRLSYEESKSYTDINRASILYARNCSAAWIVEDDDIYRISIDAEGNLKITPTIMEISKINAMKGLIKPITSRDIINISATIGTDKITRYTINCPNSSITLFIEEKRQRYTLISEELATIIKDYYHASARNMLISSGLLFVYDTVSRKRKFVINGVRDICPSYYSKTDFYFISENNNLYLINKNSIRKLEVNIGDMEFIRTHKSVIRRR